MTDPPFHPLLIGAFHDVAATGWVSKPGGKLHIKVLPGEVLSSTVLTLGRRRPCSRGHERYPDRGRTLTHYLWERRFAPLVVRPFVPVTRGSPA